MSHITKQSGPNQNTVKEYTLGFITSLGLTLISYFLVVNHLLTGVVLQSALGALATVQAAVQLMLFLNLGHGTKPRWNLILFLFTVMIILIVVVGSIWIMNNLDYNMMNKI